MSVSPKTNRRQGASGERRRALERPVNDALLEETCRRVLEVVDAETIILFGSHAYGSPTGESDVDLMIVADTHEPWNEIASRVYGQLGPRRFALDVVVRTPRQIAAAFTDDGFDPFLREVWRQGRFLYERDDGHKKDGCARRAMTVLLRWRLSRDVEPDLRISCAFIASRPRRSMSRPF